MPTDVVVVGSLNHDLTVMTPRHPKPGETVLGHGHHTGAGGKGANQAVAAARLGSRVAMIGRVGNDEHGSRLVSLLEAEGIDLTGVVIDGDAPTGLAIITVDDRAENTIVVSPGANTGLTPDDVSALDAVLRGAKVVLAQLEVPLESVAAAASATKGMFCLNPAPARELSGELLGLVDLLIPNRSELAALAGTPEPDNLEEVIEAAARISGPAAMVVTLGSSGSLVIENGEATAIEAPPVDAVDTTGAGDAFCGALATALSRDVPLAPAARWATTAGALATTKRGAQGSMPTAEEVRNLLGGSITLA